MAPPQRVALIGVGHYHSTWFPAYLSILQRQQVEIAGIHDPDVELAADRARRFESVPFTNYEEMLEKTRPEFVIGLGRHVDMPPVFRYLVESGIPFLMEKPWAIDLATLTELVEYAEARNAWAAAPLPMRYSWWAQVCRDMLQKGELGNVSHITYRMVRPGVARYIEQGCEWMRHRAEAGGGVLLNLGCHGFDTCNFVTGEDAAVVSAVTSHAVCKLDVEDYAFVTRRTTRGIICHNEVGYTLPADGDDGERKLVAERAMLVDTAGGVRIIAPGRDEIIERPAGYVDSWERVVIECLDALERGEPPPITVRDGYKAIAPIFDAYRLAGEQTGA